MFASKAGVPKKRLRLHVTGQEEPFQFSFVSPPAIAESELERFKTLLAAVVTNNSSLTVAAAPTKESKTPKSAPVSKPQTLPLLHLHPLDRLLHLTLDHLALAPRREAHTAPM